MRAANRDEAEKLATLLSNKVVDIAPFLAVRARAAGKDGASLNFRLEAIIAYHLAPNTKEWIVKFNNA